MISNNTIQNNCPKCFKPYVYIGDIPMGGFIKGLEPYCICGQDQRVNSYKYCPHCGKEL